MVKSLKTKSERDLERNGHDRGREQRKEETREDKKEKWTRRVRIK